MSRTTWGRARPRAALLLALALAVGRAAPPVAAEEPPALTAEQRERLRPSDARFQEGMRLSGEGRLVEAAGALRAAVAMREEILGPEHPLVSVTLHALAKTLDDAGQAAEALPHERRAVALCERWFGADHPHTATCLDTLSTIQRHLSALEEARQLGERALAIRERTRPAGHTEVAMSLNNLGLVLVDLGRAEEAVPMMRRSLAIREQAHGPEHPDTARGISNLAATLAAARRYEAALSLSRRAVALRERLFGEDHPETLESIGNLGHLLHDLGQLDEAQDVLERAVRLDERLLGPANRATGVDLANLGNLRLDQGHAEDARRLGERALRILEAASGPESLDVAVCLSGLGYALFRAGDVEGASAAHERLVAISRRVRGDTHADNPVLMNNLALLRQARGRNDEAVALSEEALRLGESIWSPSDAMLGNAQLALARLLARSGRWPQALARAEQALASLGRSVGDAHPNAIDARLLRAHALVELGRAPQAREAFAAGLAALADEVEARLGAARPKERLARLARLREGLDDYLLAAPRLGAHGYEHVLRLKGTATRAEEDERRQLRRGGVAAAERLEALHVAQRQLAALANAVPRASDVKARANWQARFAALSQSIEGLKAKLGATGPAGKAPASRARPSLLAEVQSRLGPREALLDVLRVRSRYVAWLVRHTGAPTRIELGSAAEIEPACEEFVASLRQADDPQEPTLVAQRVALRKQVLDPARAALTGVDTLVVSPDAALAAVPLGALGGSSGDGWLLDELTLVAVGSARDLVPRTAPETPAAGAVVLGGADYDQAEALPAEPATAPRSAAAPRGRAFEPIPGTRAEAERIAARLGAGTTLLLGAQASEARLARGAAGRRLVHVATHGFVRADLTSALRAPAEGGDAWRGLDAERQLSGYDPRLLCGLALAGANRREGGGGDDGILTALEASYLDLDGCECVVLSACETALGTAAGGEGVLGLAQGFQLAGARAVVASLWPVDDEATRLLMERFYDALLRPSKPASPAQALREASLALREHQVDGRKPYAAPRYWAAFVAYERR